MNFDKYICDLLLQNDCVIIPDFGGFVANYTSAKIHPSQHTFNPPFKNIVFNKNLKNNDGLLAHHITTAEKVSYSDACKFVTHIVDDYNKNLKRGNKIEIKNVGALYLDVEQNIQFDPDKSFNYLLDSFGLNAFQSPPIKRENYRETIPKKFVDRKTLPSEKRGRNLKRYAAIAVTIPLLFAAFWIPLKTDLIKNINYSSLNPFAGKESNISENKVNVPAKTITVDRAEKIAIDDIKSTAEESNSASVDEVPANSLQPAKSSVPVSSELLAAEDKSKKYHVIGGCFAVLNNAEKLVNKLKENGHNASIIDQFNNLYRVRYSSYADKNEALEALVKIRSSNPDAWLLVK